MEILHRGEHPSQKVYENTCFSCKTQFRFKRYEAVLVPDWRDGDYLKIGCPVCGRECTNAAHKPVHDPIKAEWGSLDR